MRTSTQPPREVTKADIAIYVDVEDNVAMCVAAAQLGLVLGEMRACARRAEAHIAALPTQAPAVFGLDVGAQIAGTSGRVRGRSALRIERSAT